MLKTGQDQQSYAEVVANNSTKNICITKSINLVARPKIITAHPDSGASETYLMKHNDMKTTNAPQLSAGYTNGQAIISNSQTQLAIPNVPKAANNARVFNQLKSGNLLSFGHLCDNDCQPTFTKKEVKITNECDQVVLTGPRDTRTGLWMVDVPLSSDKIHDQNLPPSPVANSIISRKNTKSDLAIYHVASLGNPVPSTLLPAIKKGFF